MKVKAKKAFQGPKWGNVSSGDTLDVPVDLARQLKEWGLIEEVEIDTLGKPQQSSSLQAAQASQKSNVKQSKKQETKDSAKLSESTQVSKQQSATLSMDATEDGGKSTPKKPRKKRKSGRKTSGQPKISK